MATTTKKAVKPRRKKVPRGVGGVKPLVTELNEEQIIEMMDKCENLAQKLSFLTLRLLIEQKQRRHERRMAELKQLGSAMAYLPVAFTKGAIRVSDGIIDFVKRGIAKARPQGTKATS